MDNTKLSISNILLNKYPAPYTLLEFYNHCKKYKCEELVDFVIAIYNYQEEYEFLANDKLVIPEVELDVTDGRIKDRKSRKSFVHKLIKMGNMIIGKDHDQPVAREAIQEQVKEENQPNRKRNSTFKNMEQKLEYIINTYLRSTSPKQINIPSLISDNLLKNYQGQMRGPALFEESLQHCEMILKTSPLPSFIAERRK